MNTKLQQAVLDAATQSDNAAGWRLLQGLGPMVAVLNLPLALVLGLGGVAGEAYSQRKDLSEARMPDEWLGKVASTPDVSQEGLAHLARRLADKGFVSVSDALEWLGVEEAQAEKRRQATAQQLPGAGSLLARAKIECGELLEPGLFDRATGALKTVVQCAPGILSAATKLVRK